ncbi:MAG: DUF2314 domain-containing protein [Pseudomonadota bacterium]
MRTRLLLLLTLCLAVASPLSSADDKPELVERDGEPTVVVYPSGDESMPKAIADARATVASFVEQLPALEANATAYYSVKAPIETEGGTEHIWLDSIVYEDGKFTGKLGNEPLSSELSYGQEYTLPADEVSDWMAVVDDVMFGGYTIYVSRDQLSPERREAFEDRLGFTMPATPQSF